MHKSSEELLIPRYVNVNLNPFNCGITYVFDYVGVWTSYPSRTCFYYACIPRSIVHPSGAYLEQNQPNPFDGKTVLGYYIPEGTAGAKIVITSINGQVLKSILITGKGKGQVTLPANTLAKGSYIYTLWVNGEKADSKKMMMK